MNIFKQMLAYDCQGPARDRRNRLRTIYWSLPWATAWVLSSLAIKWEWISSKPLIGLCAAITLFLGIGLILAYRRYISQADELIRKIELDALSFALGAVLVGGVTYQILVRAEILDFGNVFAVTTMFASFSYIVGIIWGHRRFL